MKRVQLFEFEDFQWFPKTIRNGMTNLIIVLMKMMGTKKVLVRLIEKVQSKQKFNRIVDLGSGSGGAMPAVIRAYNESHPNEQVELLLTDLHPNPSITGLFNKNNDGIKYHEESVDATNFANIPNGGGLKTMVNSFHHMPPEKAKAILSTAHQNKESILIYELTENKMPLIIWWLFLPISLCILIIMCLVMTPFVRPLTWQQIVFTYLIPIIPIAYAWDGQASYPRTYSFDDVNKMIADLKSEAYQWEIAPAKNSKGKNAGYYIFGYQLV